MPYAPNARKTALFRGGESGILLFALLGLGFLGAVALMGGWRSAGAQETPDATAAAPTVAVVTNESSPVPAGPVAAAAHAPNPNAGENPSVEPAGGPAAASTTEPVFQPPMPAATRGAEALIRWPTPMGPALSALDAGQPAQALMWLRQQQATHDRQPGLSGARNRVLQMRSLIALGRFADAQALPRTYTFPGTDRALVADLHFASHLAAARGNPAGVKGELLETLSVYSPDSWGTARAALERARRIEAGAMPKGQAETWARGLFQTAALSGQLELSLERYAFERLDALTAQLVLAPNYPCVQPKAVFHAVQPGDSLYKIAKQHGVSLGQLTRLNGLTGHATLRVGQSLKVLPGTTTLVVDRFRLTATLLIDGVYLRRYLVGIGPGEKTPAGTFTIDTKLTNPDWYYGGQRIPFGDPRNILGTRWMGFDKQEHGGKGAGIGVHGTELPESVPGRESKGCVRMHNEHVEEVFDWLPRGAQVIIN